MDKRVEIQVLMNSISGCLPQQPRSCARFRLDGDTYQPKATVQHDSSRSRCIGMSEKRKPTTRYQGQRPPKRRQLSSPTPPAPAPKQPTPKQAVENVKEELPVKLKESQSLPTRTELQDPHLPDVDFQNIAERSVKARAPGEWA